VISDAKQMASPVVNLLFPSSSSELYHIFSSLDLEIEDPLPEPEKGRFPFHDQRYRSLSLRSRAGLSLLHLSNPIQEGIFPHRGSSYLLFSFIGP